LGRYQSQSAKIFRILEYAENSIALLRMGVRWERLDREERQKGDHLMKKNVARVLLVAVLLPVMSLLANAQGDGPTLPPPPVPGILR
jgi:hypothetical protein